MISCSRSESSMRSDSGSGTCSSSEPSSSPVSSPVINAIVDSLPSRRMPTSNLLFFVQQIECCTEIKSIRDPAVFQRQQNITFLSAPLFRLVCSGSLERFPEQNLSISVARQKNLIPPDRYPWTAGGPSGHLQEAIPVTMETVDRHMPVFDDQAGDHAVDADHFAIHIKQRTTGVPEQNRTVRNDRAIADRQNSSKTNRSITITTISARMPHREAVVTDF